MRGVALTLRFAAEQWDEMPRWRRVIGVWVTRRTWGYTLRMWATIENEKQISRLLLVAAECWDELPAWRRWLGRFVTGRDWGYAVRTWAKESLRDGLAEP